jgi:plasmid stabilization system protein ParE
VNYRIRFHPLVARDLDAIARRILGYAGPEAAAQKLIEIEAAIATLKVTPHKGSLRDEIALGLRAIPAGRKAVIAFFG